MGKEDIKEKCNICKTKKTFEFKGVQYFKKMKVFDIYTCRKCHNSKAVNPTKKWENYKKQNPLEQALC